MIGKKVMYWGNIYIITKWVHYRLDWYDVELSDHSGAHTYQLREKDLTIL